MSDFEVCPIGTLQRLAAVEAEHDALLAEVEALRRYVDHFGDPLKCARAAISKAEGA